MKTAIQLQDEARKAAEAGDETRLEEVHAELMDRFVLGQRIAAVRVGDTTTPDGRYSVEIHLENECGLLFFQRGPNPFGIFIASTQ
jgi:hypothetical protein